ncbi:hypothetical protein GUJ93_ZPchr0006g41007 [Zizania palustris]|uniref:Uncharacterized protein n=1 Tax=Zizania palustris TaxID=103762 RepID=A0A8J5SIT2_ZIZPA|nr:hypothetical protein GUJ93_ZPchr0006g41007 [Zizania palustris]
MIHCFDLSISGPDAQLTYDFVLSMQGDIHFCQSAIVSTAPNATTYGELVARFNTTTLLGANNLPDSTSSTKAIPAKSTVRIPFPCRCANNNVGQSDSHPIYVVQPEDGLDHIARDDPLL